MVYSHKIHAGAAMQRVTMFTAAAPLIAIAVRPAAAATGVQMIDNIGQHPSPENYTLIREILMREWDPIGVRNIAGSREGEYDAYIDDVYTLVTDKHTSQEEISDYLLAVQSQRMRLSVTDAARKRCRRAAQSLIAAQMEFRRQP
jgi:hypothetical protein